MQPLRQVWFPLLVAAIVIQFLAAARPLAAQGACKAMIDADMKAFESPVHLYITSTGGARTISAESIEAGGNSYVKIGDKWSSTGKTIDKTALLEKKRQQPSNAICTHVKDEPVNGEMAALYKMTTDLRSGAKVTTQVWISKSKGVPLREEDDIESGARKTHNSTRYEYANVKAPI